MPRYNDTVLFTATRAGDEVVQKWVTRMEGLRLCTLYRPTVGPSTSATVKACYHQALARPHPTHTYRRGKPVFYLFAAAALINFATAVLNFATGDAPAGRDYLQLGILFGILLRIDDLD